MAEPEAEKERLLAYIRTQVIGSEASFPTCYGRRRVVYTDYIASGRALRCIEHYIADEVLPWYANTHTMATRTALQSTRLREEARDLVRQSVNASEHDAVIFAGSGATAGINMIVHALGVREAVDCAAAAGRPSAGAVVLVGCHEHHSNLLPWREAGATVLRVAETEASTVDLDSLERLLQEHRGADLLVGAFGAASNVTGTLCDTDAISALLHKHGALALWDYATAGPYCPINMNPVTMDADALCYKDAVFISTHKFVGGVNTPGVLIAKKHLFRSSAPRQSGGGGVFFVTRHGHRYFAEPQVREESGSQDVVGSIRAGLAFKIKDSVGAAWILEKEVALAALALDRLRTHPNLHVLGNPKADRLAVVSFMVYHPESKKYLHHNFVATFLNDMFGIQARGGCMCAGPYAQDLMGINEDLADKYEQLLLEDTRLDRVHLRRHGEYSPQEVLRPGFVRFNLPYFMPAAEVEFVLQAVLFAAEHAWAFLAQYTFDPESAEFRHASHPVQKERRWLGHVSFKSGKMAYSKPRPVKSIGARPIPAQPSTPKQCLEEAYQEASRLLGVKTLRRTSIAVSLLSEAAEKLRWFLYPSEAAGWICQSQENGDGKGVPSPFTVRSEAAAPSPPAKQGLALVLDQKKSDLRVLYEEALSELEALRADLARLSAQPGVASGARVDSAEGEGPAAAQPLLITRLDAEVEPIGDSAAKLCVIPKSVRKKKKGAAPAKDAAKIKFQRPSRAIYKPMCQAIEKFNMIRNGDRVLVCVSGGKDSLSLLHCLKQYQYQCRSEGVNFELAAATVDPGSASFDPSPLKEYMAALGMKYFFEEQSIIAAAAKLEGLRSICSYCSRMKRGRLYGCARREGYNVLAFGQHLDDIAESFLMSVFNNGSLRTMKACYVVNEGDLRMIRPFTYTREKDTRAFAEAARLPVITDNCPACFEAPQQRHRMKQLLSSQELTTSDLFSSLRTALYPLLCAEQPWGDSTAGGDPDPEDC